MYLYHKWVKEVEANEKQSVAFHKTGSTVVIAGPGSGKTRVLTLKIAKLLNDEITPPQGIACLTYTRLMAKEIEQRLYSLGVQDRGNVFTGTVHSFCLSQVVSPYANLFNVSLVDPIRIAPKDVQQTSLNDAIKDVFGRLPYNKYRNVKSQFRILKKQKADIPPDKWREDQKIASLIQRYEAKLASEGFVDFDIIIQIGLRLIIDHSFVRNSLYAKFPWMAIDEYQDLGYPLNRIVTEMIDKTPMKLFAIGDPNQSIFDFAGTDPKYLLDLAKRDDIKPAIELENNYRSHQEIIQVGGAILGVPTVNHSDTFGGECHVVECKSFDEQINQSVQIIQELKKEYFPNEIAVLHRKRKNLKQLAETFDKNDLDYVLDKHPLYDRTVEIIRWLEDLAYWCLEGWKKEISGRYNFDDLLSFWFGLGLDKMPEFDRDENNARIHFANVLWNLRDLDQSFHGWLSSIKENLFLDELLGHYSLLYPDDVSEFEKLSSLSQDDEPLSSLDLQTFCNLHPSVNITTFHSSKGSEFDAVIITGVEELGYEENDTRLLYVAATRARKKVYFLFSKTHNKIPRHIEKIVKCSEQDSWSFINIQQVSN